MHTHSSSRNSVVIYNPLAGRGKAAHYAKLAKQVLLKNNWQVDEIIASEYASHIESKLAPTWGKRVKMIVLIGGDGTLRELVGGLRSSKLQTDIAFIPMGNANVVARELNIPLKPEDAIQLCINGKAKPIDLAVLKQENQQETVFLAMLEIGIGADIVKTVDQLRHGSLKTLYRIWGDLVYAIAGLFAVLKHHEAPFDILFTQDKGLRLKSSHALITNMKTYSKGWSFTPNAQCDDGTLDVAIRQQNGKY